MPYNNNPFSRHKKPAGKKHFRRPPDAREFVGVVLPNGLLATGQKIDDTNSVKITSVEDGVSFDFVGKIFEGLQVTESRHRPF